MELNYFDLIKKTDLTKHNLFIVTGDELLQRHNIIEKITNEFKNKNFEIARHELSEQNHNIIYQEADSLSLFATNKFIHFYCEKSPKKILQQALIENISKPSENIYLLVFNELKKQNLTSKWFLNLSRNSIYINIRQPDITRAINIINFELEKINLTLTDEAIQMLVQKTEGSLIAAKQIIKLLSCQDITHFDEKTIKPFLHEHANFDVFDLSEAILSQQKSKALMILNSIINANDKSPLVLWALKKELRIILQLKTTQNNLHNKIFKNNNIWSSKQKFYLNLANNFSSQMILNCLQKCLDADLYIKGVKKGNIKLKLNEIVFELVNQ